MFKKSNAFFTGIIEGIGRLLAPHKLFWTYAFAAWAALIPAVRLFGLVPGWLFSAWMWSLPFVGTYAFAIWLGHIGYFDRPEHQAKRDKIERERAEMRAERENEERLRLRDKTRPDRR